MASDSGPVLGMVLSVQSATLATAARRSAARFGALGGMAFFVVWHVSRLEYSFTTSYFFALATTGLVATVEGTIWGGLWGGLVGWLGRRAGSPH